MNDEINEKTKAIKKETSALLSSIHKIMKDRMEILAYDIKDFAMTAGNYKTNQFRMERALRMLENIVNDCSSMRLLISRELDGDNR